jgi:hypothetical protein
LAFDQGSAFIEHLSYLLATRDLSYAGVASAVGDDDEVSVK